MADTAGSDYYRECEELIAEERFGALLDKFIDQFDLVFSKASEGESISTAPVLSVDTTTFAYV